MPRRGLWRGDLVFCESLNRVSEKPPKALSPILGGFLKHFEFLWRLFTHSPVISIACSHSNLSFLVKSAPKKRLPHGATLLLVEGAAALLARAAGEEIPITRQELHAKLTPANLSSDTIDDRIRVLVQRGQLIQVGHGAYGMPGSDLAQKAALGWRWSNALGRWGVAPQVVPEPVPEAKAPPNIQPLAPAPEPITAQQAAPQWTDTFSQAFTEERFDFNQARGRPAKRKRP